jgi:hypothetical protein
MYLVLFFSNIIGDLTDVLNCFFKLYLNIWFVFVTAADFLSSEWYLGLWPQEKVVD